jgi:hypothetical protein
MQIQLKQAEIVSALKQYIGSQGINLSGKSVEISFTAGRGQAGLTADIVIEEVALPSLDFEGEANKPALTLVTGDNTAVAPEADKVLEPDAPIDSTPAPEGKTTTSLFA